MGFCFHRIVGSTRVIIASFDDVMLWIERQGEREIAVSNSFTLSWISRNEQSTVNLGRVMWKDFSPLLFEWMALTGARSFFVETKISRLEFGVVFFISCSKRLTSNWKKDWYGFCVFCWLFFFFFFFRNSAWWFTKQLRECTDIKHVYIPSNNWSKAWVLTSC